jgi:hypothetical protein
MTDELEAQSEPAPAIGELSRRAWTRTHIRISSERKAVVHSNPAYPVEVTLKAEPRIEYIHRLLELALRYGHFTSGGREIRVTGFKLKCLEDWTRSGETSPEEILELLSERCEVKCEFCYLRMDPPGTVTKFNPNRAEHIVADVDLRLGLMAQGKRLFAPTFQLEEIIGHAEFPRVMRALRQQTDAVIYLNTTGAALNDHMLDFIASMEPVEVRVSLNSVNPAERQRIMHDKKGQVIAALQGLRRRNMRFSVSLVMWPNLTWKELEAAIRFADECGPYAIIAILPGFTRAFSDEELFDTSSYWAETVQRVSSLRHTIGTPLVAHPRLYEQNLLGYPSDQPIVIGVTPRSSAATAGVRIGDVIVGIGEFSSIVGCRQADSLLLIKHRQNPHTVSVTVRRGHDLVTLQLDVAKSYEKGYPYTPPSNDRFGIVLVTQGIAIGDLRELGRILKRRGVHSCGLATSSIVLPTLLAMMEQWKPVLFPECEIVPFVPANEFYGGNICLGELCTGSDLLKAIRALNVRRPDLELVIVPSPAFAPGGWWRDLEGASFTRLMRDSPLPVDILVCSAFE